MVTFNDYLILRGLKIINSVLVLNYVIMARIKTFEEINAWLNARNLVSEIYQITKQKDLSRDFGFKDQIQRAAVSIMSNIAEGYERQSEREFKRFLFFSRGSAGEVRSLLYVARDLQYIDDALFDKTLDSILTISKQIYRLIEYLDSCQKKNNGN